MSFAKAEMNVTQRLQQADTLITAMNAAFGAEDALSNYAELILPASQELKEMSETEMIDQNKHALEALLK